MNIKDSATLEDPYRAFFSTLTTDDLKREIARHLLSYLGRDPQRANCNDLCKAVSYVMRDMLVDRWIKTQKGYYAGKQKRVYYLSLEFLIGRSLGNCLINLGFLDKVGQAVEELGFRLEDLRDEEEDAALGNGGLGRLAACFLDSMATLRIPAYGYGIRYEYGLFFQRLMDGYQVENPDNWLRYGCPWEFERPHYLHPVNFFGRVESYVDDQGRNRRRWIDTDEIMAMASDILVPGYRNDHVLNMRLWTAKASREFDLGFFNRGNYIAAVESKMKSETISKLLYPTDHIREGRELRLKQQYFFVAATFQDIFRRYKKLNMPFERFSEFNAVQLNDTHPAIAIPEMMRLLIDIEGLDWDKAWKICVDTFGYTNHTLMPEALEKWSVDLLGRVLPRHLEIIYDINRKFLEKVATCFADDPSKMKELSIVEEAPVKSIRMAHLAIVGSHSVNGVARLHTDLLKERMFPGFHKLYPGRFNCKTNGITPRRWLLKCNPGLAALINEKIGTGWEKNLEHLVKLESFADDPVFQDRWMEQKKANKKKLTHYIEKQCGVVVDVDSLFDVQVKRIHEYKRQLLNVLHIISLYHCLLDTCDPGFQARTFIFAGKAAPSYWRAKMIIKLINSVAEVINNDERINNKIKVVFIPNYGVSVAEKIIPAVDLSEQISTAGTEASGTGNMKLALNGGLTIGTLDGANIEILEEVGEENIFIFGMTADQVEQERRNPSRTPQQIYEENNVVRAVIRSIANGYFSHGDTMIFNDIVSSLLDPAHPYLLLHDFDSYRQCQEKVARAFADKRGWARKSILNVARMGKFSSDRTIREYAEEIWGIEVKPDKDEMV
jgi:starch phosphorylase